MNEQRAAVNFHVDQKIENECVNVNNSREDRDVRKLESTISQTEVPGLLLKVILSV